SGATTLWKRSWQPQHHFPRFRPMSLRPRAPDPGGDVTVTVEVNGSTHSARVAPAATLLDVLREHLQLTGTKVGCARGEGGACTVLIGDRAVTSCLVLAATVAEPVTTIEGISAAAADLRTAFADTGGFQCGFCTPGQLVSAEAFLRSLTDVPTDA